MNSVLLLPKGMKSRLAVKISGLLIAILVIGFASLSYVFVSKSRETSIIQLKEFHVGASDEISTIMETSLLNAFQDLHRVETIMSDSRISDSGKIACAENILLTSREIDFFAFYDANGRLLDQLQPRERNGRNGTPERLIVSSTRTPSVDSIQIIYPFPDSLPYLLLSTPWRPSHSSGTGDDLGFIVTVLSLSPVSTMVTSMANLRFSGNGATVSVVNDHGTAIISSNIALVRRRANLFKTDLFAGQDFTQPGLLDRNFGFVRECLSSTGRHQLASFSATPRYRMGILVEEPLENALAPIAEMTRQLTAWIGTIILLSIVFGIIFARSITRPLRTLAQGTHGIIAGEYGMQLPVTTSDEVADLTHSFNTMSADLKKSFTELKEANDHIVRAEKMVLRGEIVAEVSHELKNFLALLLIQCQALRRKLSKFDIQTFQTGLDNLQDGLKRMNSFSDNLLVRSGSAINLRRTSLNEMTSSFVAFISVLPKFRRGSITAETHEDLLCSMIDIDQMRQVLLNLVNNAFDAAEEPDLIFRIAENSADHTVTIAVSDNGPGIPPDVQAKLFNERITTKKDGHGFGLPICRKIIQAHGGDISFTSEPGAGTTFLITLPKVDISEEPKATE